MEELVHKGLLELDENDFQEVLSEMDEHVDWLQTNYEHYQHMQDNPPNDISLSMVRVLAGRCVYLSVYARTAAEKRKRLLEMDEAHFIKILNEKKRIPHGLKGIMITISKCLTTLQVTSVRKGRRI
jgi:hypothetical protein